MNGGDDIHIVGPSEARAVPPGALVVNTTSHSRDEWTRALSPFYLGPIRFDDGRVAQRLENAWQYSKVYPGQIDASGAPGAAWARWSAAGFANPRAIRYPMGRGAKPLFLWFAGEQLDYLQSRKEVYFPMYRNAVLNSGGFERLRKLAEQKRPLWLFDFDGYDHVGQGLSLADVLNNPARPMGHAFVLKAMLRFGPDVTPQMIEQADAGFVPPTPRQADLLAALQPHSTNVIPLRPR